MDIEATENRVVVGPSELLARRGLVADRVNWITERTTGPFDADVRIRYNGSDAPAVVDPEGSTSARVKFRAPQRAVAPGQSVVFYLGDEVIGGGTIETAIT